jgi:hypothetical protein
MPQLQDAYSDIPLDQAGLIGGPTPAAAPPLGFFQKVGLGAKQDAAGPDWGFNQIDWQHQALEEVYAGLRKRGVEPVDPFGPVRQLRGETPKDSVDRRWRALFGQVAAARLADPKLLPDYAAVGDRAGFDQLIADRRNASLAEVQRDAPDGLGAAGFLGGVVHRLKDPTSYIPVGGGATAGLSFGQQVLRTALREAAANAGFTAAAEPLVRLDAAKLGQQRTIGDTLFDLGLAGAAGAAIGGTFEAAHGAPRAIGERYFPGAVRQHDADAFGRALNAEIKRTDISPGSPFASFDATVARLFGAVVPPEQRTPEEQAALHAVERDAEVKASSPFLPGPEGDDHHSKWLDLALHAATGEGPALPSGQVRPIEREALASGGDASETRFPGREQLKARIHSVEGPHGGRNLLGSNAVGPYQFEPRTWVNLFRRRYPGDKRSFDQIAALREDPHLNDVMINDLIAENAATLRNAGLGGEDARNLYIAHVLGSDKAVRVLRARGEARLGDLLPESYFAKNPFKPDWTANQMRAWADKRMGGAGAVEYAGQTARAPEEAAGAEPIPTGRYDVDALFTFGGIEGDRPVLDPARFDRAEEHAAAQVRFERERDAAEGYAPVASREELFNPYEHAGALRAYAAQRGTVTAEAIGEALGISPAEAGRVVASMQATDPNSPYMISKGRAERLHPVTGEVLQAGAEPRIIRRPPKPGTARGPESLLEFLSRHGGLNDEGSGSSKGGDFKSMGANDWHKEKPFRTKLLRPGGLSPDDAFTRAIEAGYFPELQARDFDAAHLPDLDIFHEAVSQELHGKPRFTPEDAADAAEAARRVRYGDEPAADAGPGEPVDVSHMPADDLEFIRGMLDRAKGRGLDLDEDLLDDAYLLATGHGVPVDEALDHAALASAYRNMDQLAAETGNSTYASEGFANDDGGFPEQRGDQPGDLPLDAGGRGPEGEAGVATQARTRLAELADDPKRADFHDPVGPAAEAQADSVIHDLEVARPANAPESPETYRLDEEGGESDLQSILDEIEEAQKAAATMRDCLKPRGGGE